MNKAHPLQIARVGVFLLALFPSLASASSTPIAVEQIPSENKNEILFSVSVSNEAKDNLQIKTDYGEVVHYRLDSYDTAQEIAGFYFQGDVIILSGEKKAIRYFRHDLTEHPSSNPNKAVVKVRVSGVGEVTHEFELEKPGFFENLLGGIFGANPSTGSGQGPSKDAGQGDVGQGNESNVIASPAGAKQSASHPAVPSSVIPAQAGIQAPASESSTSPVTNETPVNQTPPSTTPQPTEPQVQTPVEEPEPEEPSAPMINPPAQLPSDTTPPAAPTVNSLPQAVNAVSVILSGAKDLNSSIWINGVERVTVNNSASWTFDMPLAEGTNLLRIESRDPAGNASSAVTVSVIRDTTTPTIESVNVTSLTESGATIQLQASENVSATLTYQVEGAADPQSLIHSTRAANHEFIVSGLTPNTSHSFFITIQDQVAQQATSASFDFTTPALDSPYENPVLISGLVPFIPGSTDVTSYLSMPDLNGDGIEELGMLNESDNFAGVTQSFYIAYSSADGTYKPEDKIEMSSGFVLLTGASYAYLLEDFNNDGVGDLLLTTGGAGWIF